jgi:hypothetical protein
LITYMRTDSTRISETAQREALDWIKKHFGESYLPDTPRRHRVKAGAQDAHEAIRPTSVARTPEMVKSLPEPGSIPPLQADLGTFRGQPDGFRHHGCRLRGHPRRGCAVSGDGFDGQISRLYEGICGRFGRKQNRRGRTAAGVGEAGKP